MENKEPQGNQPQGALLSKVKTRIKRPALYKVVLMNDDFTPMDFVVYILKNFFGKQHEQAVSIMLQVHNKGVGICGTYTRDVAETKAEQVMAFAHQNEHPLRCLVEKA